MKKSVLLGVIFLLLSHLNAQWFISNSIGMPLEETTKEEALKQTWALHLSEDEHSLYKENTLYEHTTITKHHSEITHTTTLSDQSVQKKIYTDGLLTTVIERDNNHERTVLYTYDDQRLYEVATSVDNQLIQLVTYYRTQQGSLIGVRLITDADTVTESLFTQTLQVPLYAYTDNELYLSLSFISSNMVVEQRYVKGENIVDTTLSYEDDMLVVKEQFSESDVREKYYNQIGRLIKEMVYHNEELISQKEFVYDSFGELREESEQQIKGELSQTKRYYKDGKVESLYEYTHHQPIRSQKFLEDGRSIVTHYEDGRDYVDITYAQDQRTVLQITYREENR
ncbi:MAG: hypothetical protein ACOX0W_07370 [Sphaerochaetaceae bacterium]|jgi:antitoxin component YwqK of YwqJK toxin-antitoxin module